MESPWSVCQTVIWIGGAKRDWTSGEYGGWAVYTGGPLFPMEASHLHQRQQENGLRCLLPFTSNSRAPEWVNLIARELDV